jgi:hypothetical protein
VIRTIEALIDATGSVQLSEPIVTDRPRRVLVTILDEEPDPSSFEMARLSEPVLAADWNRPEEDEAWSHLQPGRSLG